MANPEVGDDVFIVLFELFIWDEDNNNNELSGFNGRDDELYMLLRIAEAFKNGNPPDRVTLTNDWALFVLNEITEYFQDFGVNGIKGDLNPPTRGVIADAAEIRLGQNPNTWPVNPNQETYDMLNELLNPTPLP